MAKTGISRCVIMKKRLWSEPIRQETTRFLW